MWYLNRGGKGMDMNVEDAWAQGTFLSLTLYSRVRPRFLDQVGHKAMYACSGNKHFFTKSCHRQTYHNYEQPPRTSQNSYFQSHFSVLKIG